MKAPLHPHCYLPHAHFTDGAGGCRRHFTFVLCFALVCTACHRADSKQPRTRAEDEQRFEQQVRTEGNGWLTRHLGSRVPNVPYAYATLERHRKTIQEQRESLHRTIVQLSSSEAQSIVCKQLSELDEQDAKLARLLENLEEITYTYLLMSYAHQVIPTQVDDEELSNIVSEIGHAINTVEEIEQEIQHIHS